MKAIQVIVVSLLLVLSGQPAQAEDIDIYSGLTGTANIPNVMIIIDNAANSNANMSACTYWDGATPTGSNQGTKSLDNYMCALDSIVHGMTLRSDGSALVNLGITTQNGVFLKLTPVDDNTYTGTYAHTAGQTNRQVLSKAIRALTDQPGNATQGASFQETWAYYTGGNGGTTNVGLNSGTTYTGTNATTGCQKNYNIFISGVTSSAHANTKGGEQTVLNAAVDNAVAAGSITSAMGATLKTQITSSTESPWGVEWARFMYNVDANSSGTGVQSIITYSVAAGSPVYPAAMGSMEKYIYSTARYGGGKYFAATSYTNIYDSILKILNEVQSVNSVFASSSLPVSVNAQGTYLNQIFMGMFRPDGSAYPRWVGNLKQYKFVYNVATQTLKLGDSIGASAISSAGTGFISSNAISYWTCGGASGFANARACSPVADPASGFWVNNPQSVGGAYDLPDGEVVEKGGVAQIMRLANLTDDYTTAAGTSTNPRKLYTWCPSLTNCAAALSDASNAFATTNASITAAMFGSASLLTVSSIVRTGTSALVTTAQAHGYATGNPVQISGANQSEYNNTFTITVNSATTFTITGLPDSPTTPNTGAYQAAIHNSAAQVITGVSLATSTTANTAGCASGTIPNINCNQVTVTIPAHGYSNGNNINIQGVSAGVTPNPYSGVFTIANVTTNTFTYNVPVTPKTPSVNVYSAQLPTPASKSITSIVKSGANYIVTANAHGYVNGQSVTISGNSVAAYNGTWTVASKTTNTFNIASSGNPGTGTGGTVTLNRPVISIAAGNISRASATATTATATGITASAFANGNTVTLKYVSGSGVNETEYAPLSGSSSVVITCTGTCTSFTFPITTNTGTATTLTTASPTAALSSTPVTIPAGALTRPTTTTTAGAFVTGVTYTIATLGTTDFTLIGAASNTVGVAFNATGPGSGTGTATTVAIAKVTGVTNTFTNGAWIDISVSGAAVGTESAYLSPAAGWQITCPVACSTVFTFGPVTLSPATPATGTVTAYYGASPPPRDPLINWVRGQDNFGDESGPGGGVTVRPSLHGDVLHSRPVVVNYGGTTGIVVYYGDNGGVFHAVNGNQTNPAGSSMPAPGSELWGFIPDEFYGRLNRLRSNSPLLLLPSTPAGIVPAPEKKDYFVDGPIGIYQLLNTNGTTNTAYIYLAMRRGEQLLYALDVSNPTNPQFLWEVDPVGGLTTTAGPDGSQDYAELGQTWSTPKVAVVDGYANPVLIFGAGYDDGAEDSEPPQTDSMGRGIFILDALTGAMVWSATPNAGDGTCTNTSAAPYGTATKASCTVSGMNYSIPSDITLMDRDGDGKIDRLYAVDVGGNVWRVDLHPTSTHTTPNYWQVNKLAALGCSTGVCTNPPTSSANTPAKFFYPADVVTTPTYDAVIVGQGDREHPLYTNASYSVSNRIFMLKDTHTGNDGSGSSAITLPGLFNATSTTYDGTLSGYYINLGSGEKVINAPTTVAGFTYVGTNQPATPSSNSCTANLGVARSYKLGPLTGNYTSSIFSGGGMPPSVVAGVVNVEVTNTDGTTSNKLVPFLMGGGDPTCPDGSSALGGCKPSIVVPTSRNRIYWYQEMD